MITIVIIIPVSSVINFDDKKTRILRMEWRLG